MKRLLTWVDPGQRPLIAGLVLGLAHGVTFALAYPPFDAWALVFVAPLPLLVLLSRTSGPCRSAWGVWLASLPGMLWHHQWIADVSALGLPLLVMYLGLFPATFVWAGARLRDRLPLWVLGPLLWAGLEVIKGDVGFTGYPWFLLAHPLIVWERFALASAHVGVYALSACVVLVSAVVASYLVHGWSRSRFGVVALLFVGVLLAVTPVSPGSERRAKVIAVQTAVPQSNRSSWTPEQRERDFVRAMRLTLYAHRRWPDADLIVWPETMFPGVTLTPEVLEQIGQRFPTPYADTVKSVSGFDLRGTPWLLGAIGYDGYTLEEDPGAPRGLRESWDARYNSVFLIEDGETLERYDKRRLAPFGEVLPYFNLWPWLEQQVLALGARGMSFDLDAGDDPTVLETRAGLRVATPICFEAAANDACADLVFDADGARRADLLVNMTNDGWFADHVGGREHHLLVARWRCAQLRTPMVRCANTGITIGVDQAGGLVKGSFYEESGTITAPFGREDAWGVLLVEVPLGDGGRPVGIGRWMALGLGLLALIGVVWALLPKGKGGARPEAGAPSYDEDASPTSDPD